MNGFNLIVSNRMEVLLEALAATVAVPLSSPLLPEIVVIQSKGMERWLSMELARRHRIAANFRFPFPNHFLTEVFAAVLASESALDAFDPDVITWRIADLLPQLRETPGFESLRPHLAEDRRRVQLAALIADTFDQYVVFRPEMIFAWEQGREHHWQAVLWRRLRRLVPGEHRAALGRAFIERLRTAPPPLASLPERVSLFGISALPPFHLHMFAALAEVIPVYLFLLNPCREYWGDLVSESRRHWIMEKGANYAGGHDDLHLAPGNSLLAALGNLGRDFLDLVYNLPHQEQASFREPEGDSLLARIQADILHLRQPEPQAAGSLVSAADNSIQVHSCHSPMREVEVLRDQLLQMFDQDADLEPGDILVMAPDIEQYAPLVEAVFGAGDDGAPRIPYSIADRTLPAESLVLDAFLRLLELEESRLGANELLALLECDPIRRRFELAAADIDRVRTWLKQAGVRWGMDGDHLRRLDLPPHPQHTWKAGMDRLLLGYALPPQAEQLFAGIYPCGDIEGEDGVLCGRLLKFIHTLFGVVTGLCQPRTPQDWALFFNETLEAIFQADEDTATELQQLRFAFWTLADAAAKANYQQELHIDAIRWLLQRLCRRQGFGYGFLTGGVTFCAMLPMRAIPCKVICILGLNGDTFPRQAARPDFDLMLRRPRPGDRSRRNDDRYLFLEAIISARRRLYLSYVGQSLADNSPLPPSVVISELLDYIARGYRVAEGDIRQQICIDHPLQPFSPAYFQGDRKLCTYNRAAARTAAALLAPRRQPLPLLASPLVEPDDHWRQLTLEDLVRFWLHPAAFLLSRRLGLALADRDLVLEDNEPLEPSPLERFHLRRRILEARLAGADLDRFSQVLQAAAALPPGSLGRCTYEDLRQEMEAIARRLEPLLAAGQLPPVDQTVSVADFRLRIVLGGLSRDFLLYYLPGPVGPKDLLRCWLHHLAANLLSQPGLPQTTILLGLGRSAPSEVRVKICRFEPVATAPDLMSAMLHLYWEGLRRPLPFSPRASYAYAHGLYQKPQAEARALAAAAQAWQGSDFHRGESEDYSYHLCFRGLDVLDEEFRSLAINVWTPLFEHQDELEEI